MNKQRIIGIVMRHLYLWPRTLERLTGAFGWPIFDLIIWGMTTSYLMKNSLLSVSLVTIMLGGLIFWTITWRVQNDVSVNMLDDAWNKNLLNIFASPISQTEYVVALMILSLIFVVL